MIHELRVYDIVPGQTERQLDLFKNTVIPLFDKHAIKVVGFWETVDSENAKLVYVCEFDDEDNLRRAWKEFREDSEWIRAKEANDAKGPSVAKITSTVMRQLEF